MYLVQIGSCVPGTNLDVPSLNKTHYSRNFSIYVELEYLYLYHRKEDVYDKK